MADKRLRIALICFDNPFLPPAEGGKRGMQTRIESLLYEDRYDVDVYLMNKRSEGMAASFGEIGDRVHAIAQYPMRGGAGVLAGPFPICVNKRYVDACVRDLKGKQYDIAIYEGEQVAKYRMRNAVNARHHILYMHDIESAYRAEITKSQSGVRRLANLMESRRFGYIERRIDRFFDRVWFVSKDECETFSRSFASPDKGVYIPFPALQIADRPAAGSQAHRMLYVGDMSIRHNYLSVAWFARDVLPRIKAACPDAELMAVGRISPEDADALRLLGVNVCGYVDDLDAAYDEAACIVAPVLFGAGVKVKTIDAIARGQIVVTTAKGVEGTELQSGRHLLVEDLPDRLAALCCEILRDRAAFLHIAAGGLDYVAHVHTIAHQADIIAQEFALLTRSSQPIMKHMEDSL